MTKETPKKGPVATEQEFDTAEETREQDAKAFEAIDRGDGEANQEPKPERNSIQELLDEGSGPLKHGGELRGDQKALRNESQHGNVERPTAHRGRD